MNAKLILLQNKGASILAWTPLVLVLLLGGFDGLSYLNKNPIPILNEFIWLSLFACLFIYALYVFPPTYKRCCKE
jgi:hypothetical protein